MVKPVVLLDASVFPAVWLLDIMLTLDEGQVIDAVWSERIPEEAVASVGQCRLLRRISPSPRDHPHESS